MHAFILLQEHLEMARAEIVELLKPVSVQQFDEILLCEKIGSGVEKLGLCQKALRIVHISEDVYCLGELANFVEGSFCVRFEGNREVEKKVGGMLFDSIEDAEVDMRNPDTKIEILEIGGKYYFGVVEFVSNGMDERKSHNRPEPHPSSLHPRVARAMVNLLGDCEKIVDPFCGSGGLLLEAGLTGHEVEGFDIDQIQVNRARINCEHFGVKCVVEVKDATSVKDLDYFVCDLPYGLNTKTSEHLYERFFEDLKFTRAVVGFPSSYDYSELLKDRKIIHEFTLPLHKTLKKKIVVIS